MVALVVTALISHGPERPAKAGADIVTIDSLSAPSMYRY